MEISNKNILLVIMAVCGFLYLSDKFKQPLFQVKLRDSINKTIGYYTSHSVVETKQIAWQLMCQFHLSQF
jgi:hypothetical protein